MSDAPVPAARQFDPVGHTMALGGFIAGALIGIAAAAGVAVVAGMAATAVAAEVASAGLATPLVAGVAVTVGEFGVNAVVGGKLMGLAEEAGEALGAAMIGPPTGLITTGSPNVLVNGLPAARVADLESCDAGLVAQGSARVLINGRPAARVGDKVSCGAVILRGSCNVFIGGGTATALPIQSEVPEWVRWAAVIAGLLPALGAAARAIGPALAEVEASGLARAAQTGVKALGRAMEERAGGTPERAPTQATPVEGIFTPKKPGQVEPGAVPASAELKAQMRAASQHTSLSADGYPDLPESEARNFGEGARPWNGDDEPGTIYRVVGADSNPNGAYWQRSLPENEGEWRSGSAVLNDWNGDGGYVQSSTAGLKGWIGPAAPQMSSDGTSMLAGQGEQIWLPPGSAAPSAAMRTPWNSGE